MRYACASKACPRYLLSPSSFSPEQGPRSQRWGRKGCIRTARHKPPSISPFLPPRALFSQQIRPPALGQAAPVELVPALRVPSRGDPIRSFRDEGVQLLGCRASGVRMQPGRGERNALQGAAKGTQFVFACRAEYMPWLRFLRVRVDDAPRKLLFIPEKYEHDFTTAEIGRMCRFRVVTFSPDTGTKRQAQRQGLATLQSF